MGIEDIRDALIIRERSAYLLTDPTGNVAGGNGQGFVLHPPAIDKRSMHFSYTGIDGRERSTRIQFDVAPERIDESSASFHLTLQRRETTTLRISIFVDHHVPRRARSGSRIDAIAEQY